MKRVLLRRLVPVIPLLVLVPAYVSSSLTDVIYARTVVSRSVSSIFLIGPAVGAWAAWRASILRRGRVANLAPARSVFHVLGRDISHVLAGGLAILGLAIVWGSIFATHMLDDLAGRAEFDVRVVGMGGVVLMGHAVVGYAAGVRLPPVVAVSGAFVLLYLWMVFPPAWEPLWIRHLTGFMDGQGCCGPAREWDPSALTAPVVVALAFMLAGVIVAAHGTHLPLRVCSAVIVLGLGAVSGGLLVRHLDARPSRPRSSEELACVEGPTRVCLWPEHADRSDEVVDLIHEIEIALDPWGILVPDRITEAAAAPMGGPDVLNVRLHPFLDRRGLHGALLGSLVPERPSHVPGAEGRPDFPPGCPLPSPEREPEGLLWSWLAVQTGLMVEPPWGLPSADEAELAAVLQRPRAEQIRWYSELHDALESCAPALRYDFEG